MADETEAVAQYIFIGLLVVAVPLCLYGCFRKVQDYRETGQVEL